MLHPAGPNLGGRWGRMQQPMDQVEMMSGSALDVRHSTDVEADHGITWWRAGIRLCMKGQWSVKAESMSLDVVPALKVLAVWPWECYYTQGPWFSHLYNGGIESIESGDYYEDYMHWSMWRWPRVPEKLPSCEPKLEIWALGTILDLYFLW